MSTLTEQGVMDVKQVACDRLLASRVEAKLQVQSVVLLQLLGSGQGKILHLHIQTSLMLRAQTMVSQSHPSCSVHASLEPVQC